MNAPNRAQRAAKRESLVALGERIREERTRRGITQAMLARQLDLSVAYVSLIERGGRNPPYTTVVDIARALGVTTARLVGG
jgi:transcriptional regulator with XRE-family HTH domain